MDWRKRAFVGLSLLALLILTSLYIIHFSQLDTMRMRVEGAREIPVDDFVREPQKYLEAGDFLVEMSGSPAIKLEGFLGAVFHHIAVVYNESGVIEATVPRVRFTPFDDPKKGVTTYRLSAGAIVILRLKEEYRSRIPRILEFLKNQIGKPYDYSPLDWGWTDMSNNIRFYCSELGYKALKYAGIPVKTVMYLFPLSKTPDSFILMDIFEVAGVVKKEEAVCSILRVQKLTVLYSILPLVMIATMLLLETKRVEEEEWRKTLVGVFLGVAMFLNTTPVILQMVASLFGLVFVPSLEVLTSFVLSAFLLILLLHLYMRCILLEEKQKKTKIKLEDHIITAILLFLFGVAYPPVLLASIPVVLKVVL